MQAYDLIMLIVLGMSTIFGAIKGFAWQVASLASVLVSYVVAYRFRFQVAEMIQATPPWNQFLAMLILFVGTSFVIWVGFRLLSGMIDKVRLKEFDRHMGAAFGFAKGLIYCLLITMFAMSLLGPNQQTAICQSRSGYYIAAALDRGVGILPREIHDVVGPYLVNLDDKLKNGQSQPPATTSQDNSAWAGQVPNIPSLPNFLAESLPSLPTENLPILNGQGEAGGPGANNAQGLNLPGLIPQGLNPQTPQGLGGFNPQGLGEAGSWQLNQNFQNSGNVLPPVGSGGNPGINPPQNFPPLSGQPSSTQFGAAAGYGQPAALPSSGGPTPQLLNGLRPSGQQARQPAAAIPR